MYDSNVLWFSGTFETLPKSPRLLNFQSPRQPGGWPTHINSATQPVSSSTRGYLEMLVELSLAIRHHHVKAAMSLI
jgi:hypothetical protein